ncbi:MAG: hypothetical protein JST00_24375 [Deltaproteobacteria bacterium]|nr:hypothetical protein [Deltaproteobacteria bacterium]
MNDRMKTTAAVLGVMVAVGSMVGCAAPTAGDISGIDSNTTYVAEQDAAKANEIASRMWTTMTSAQCWYMKGSTNNYSFSGYLQYRYAGYETTAGQLVVSSVGKFGPYDAADVVIGSSQYWIGVVDAQTLVMSTFYNGQLVSNAYIAVGPGGQCV